jgi:hypothetical protein
MDVPRVLGVVRRTEARGYFEAAGLAEYFGKLGGR